MRFSIAKLIVVIFLASIVFCLTFAVDPYIGIPLLTFVSLFLIPPVLLVGAVNTRGAKQAFFLGCMISGIAHFVVSVYLALFVFMGALTDWGDEEVLRYLHLGGYIFGLIGGCAGVGAYFFVKQDDAKDDTVENREQRIDPLEIDEFDDVFEDQSASDALSGNVGQRELAGNRPPK